MKFFTACLFSLSLVTSPAHALFIRNEGGFSTDTETGLHWILTPQEDGAVVPDELPEYVRYATFDEGRSLFDRYVRSNHCSFTPGPCETPEDFARVQSFIHTLIGDPLASPFVRALFSPNLFNMDAAYVKLFTQPDGFVFEDIQFGVPPPVGNTSMLLVYATPEPNTVLLILGALLVLGGQYYTRTIYNNE